MTAVIEDMTVGWHPFAPTFGVQWAPGGDVVHILGPVFERLDGLRWHNGYLERRQAIDVIPDSDQPPTGYSPTNAATGDFEAARYIWQLVFTPTPVSRTRLASTVLVTDFDIYVESNVTGGWLNVTPTYTQGNSQFTSGSTAVNIGGGATLLTDNISVGQHIFNNSASEWLEIAAVNAEQGVGAIDTVTAATAGVGANQNLEIRRNFVPTGDFDRQLFARIFNGDLYVGGNSVGGRGEPAVVKIVDILTRTGPPTHSIPTTSTNYLCSRVVLESDGTPDSGDSIFQLRGINGLDVLQDGRVVILTQEPGNQLVTSIADRISRFRYSSNLDQTLWTLPPGGFTDVVAGGAGVMTALGRLGRVSTIHYHDSVALGQPTGQADPPLNFDTARAEIGSAFPRTNRLIAGREWFVGYDGSVYTFNGSTTEMVSDAFRLDTGGPSWLNTQTFDLRIEPTGWIDTLRQEYCFSVNDSSMATNFVGCINYRTGQARRERYDDVQRIYAASDTFVGALGNTAASGTRQEASRVAGGAVFHVGGVSPAPNFLFNLKERQDQDEIGVGGLPFGVRLTTHPLDFGMPGVVKIIERVIIHFSENLEGSGFSDDIEVRLNREDERFNPDMAAINTRTITYNGNEAIRPEHFEFDYNKSAESWAIAFNMTAAQFAGGIKKIEIRFQVLGEHEALFNPGP